MSVDVDVFVEADCWLVGIEEDEEEEVVEAMLEATVIMFARPSSCTANPSYGYAKARSAVPVAVKIEDPLTAELSYEVI